MAGKWTFGTGRLLALVAALAALPGCDRAPKKPVVETAAAPATSSSRAEIFGRLADTFVDVAVETYYAAWRSPAEGNDDDREAACAKFRDFDTLFYADGIDGPGRYIFLLDRLLRDLAAGKTTYPVECVDRRGSRAGKPCDAKAVASGLSIRKLGSGQTESERETENSFRRIDRLHFRIGKAHDHPVILVLTIDSEQHFGRQSMDEGDIRSARLEMEII